MNDIRGCVKAARACQHYVIIALRRLRRASAQDARKWGVTWEFWRGRRAEFMRQAWRLKAKSV